MFVKDAILTGSNNLSSQKQLLVRIKSELKKGEKQPCIPFKESLISFQKNDWTPYLATFYLPQNNNYHLQSHEFSTEGFGS